MIMSILLTNLVYYQTVDSHMLPEVASQRLDNHKLVSRLCKHFTVLRTPYVMNNSSSMALFQPGKIGNVETRNRFIRSATSESMADTSGFITPAYRDLHLTLARSGVGLQFTGHIYVHPQGRYTPDMTGLSSDEHIEPFRSLTREVQSAGSRFFAQLNHAGSQSRDPSVDPIAPSVIPNLQHGRTPKEATEEQIREIIKAFGQAAGRVKEAGFDGVHLHAGHGYLLTEFMSPYANRREDKWGGSLENRQRLLMEVVRVIQGTVGPDFPFTVKLGMRDFVSGGVTLEEGLDTAEKLDQIGIHGLEVSAGLISAKIESAAPYAGVSRKRALQDKLIHRLFSKPVPEAYFRETARKLREVVRCPIILVGGIRTVEMMESIVADNIAEFVSLARPFIREPELVHKIKQGKRGLVDCTSCNICLMHEGFHSLRCWRKSNKDLLRHAWHRFTGKLH